MIRILHLFDAEITWEQRVQAGLLIERLPADRFACRAAVLEARHRRLAPPGPNGVDVLPRRLAAQFLSAPAVRSYLHRHQIDLVHAWGADAPLAVVLACPQTPIVVARFDPYISLRQGHRLRAAMQERRFAIACPAQTVRRRLMEQGLPEDVCPVIRPGIDLGAINAARRQDVRGGLDLSPDDRVLIAPEPATPRGGQFVACWTAAVRSFVEPQIRLILPGTGRERDRIARLTRQLGLTRLLRCPGESPGFETLVAAADVLLCPPSGDASSSAIAWAMAAGVPVIATAVYSTAELIANRQNGLLVKPDAAKRLAVKLAALLEQEETLARLREVARGQAYQVFSVRRYVAQHARLYDNITSGRPVGDGISDAAYDTHPADPVPLPPNKTATVRERPPGNS